MHVMMLSQNSIVFHIGTHVSLFFPQILYNGIAMFAPSIALESGNFGWQIFGK
jgi:hypothetical protein